MALSKSNFFTRLLTGAIFVLVLLGSILFNQYVFLTFFSVIQVLALREFYGLINTTGKAKVNWVVNAIAGLAFYLGAFLYFSGIENSALVFTPYVFCLLLIFISALYIKESDAIQSLAYSIFGQIYIAIPIGLIHYLAFAYTAVAEYHYIFLLALFILIWVNDSFAYLTGSLLGKRRLFERISPKKSWEGSIGGALFTVVASVVLSHFYIDFSVCGWIGFALVVVIFGTFGDLVESLLKRTIGVKDSGALLPGHGGVLDRFDSMIFSIPALFVYLIVLKSFFC